MGTSSSSSWACTDKDELTVVFLTDPGFWRGPTSPSIDVSTDATSVECGGRERDSGTRTDIFVLFAAKASARIGGRSFSSIYQ
jgi:hypothetical protein